MTILFLSWAVVGVPPSLGQVFEVRHPAITRSVEGTAAHQKFLERASRDSQRVALEECFNRLFADCRILGVTSSALSGGRYEFDVSVDPGRTTDEAFGYELPNQLDRMRELIVQQESEGYWADLQIGANRYRGRVFFADGKNGFTSVKGSKEVPIQEATWGHPASFALRFDLGGRPYLALGRQETSGYLFGTEVTVTATVYDLLRGNPVGTLSLDD